MLACSYHSIYLFIECLCSYIYMHGRAGHVFGSVAAQLMYSFAVYVVLKFSPYHVCARDRCCTLFAVLAVPDRPDPPVLVNVTHHSVELKWDAPNHDLETGKLRYCLQEEGEKSKGFTNVYK